MCFRFKRLSAATVASALLLSPAPAWSEDLLSAYRMALNADADFMAARAAEEVGEQVVTIARSQVLPYASASLGFFKNRLDTKTDLSQRYDEYPSKSAIVSVRQPLFRPGSFVGVRQANEQRKATRAIFSKAENDLILRVANAYFLVTLANEQVASLVSQQAHAAGQLQAAKASMRAGQGTRTDVDDAQARYDLIASRLLTGWQQLDEAKSALQAITGPEVKDVRGIDPSKLELSPVGSATLEDWVDAAEERNPELLAIRSQAAAAKLEVLRATAAILPTADLVVQRSISQSDNIVNPNARYTNNQIGIQLSMPIYTGGYNSAKLTQAKASQREVEAKYEGARRKLELQVQKEFNAVRSAIDRIQALELAARSAEQALVSNQKGYQAGTRSRLDILEAEEKRANVYLELNRERVSYVMSRMRLLAIADQLDEDEVARVNLWLS